MPDDTSNLPALPVPSVSLDEVLGSNLPVSLRMMLDDRLYDKAKQLAGVMSKAEGFTPKHLLGKAEACFVVISCSLNWKMDPHFVARSTYQTPGGSIGFEGKLIQAILEQSGRIEGGVQYEWTGDWNRLVGKYQIVTGGSGKPYPKATWTPQDAIGLGIIVRAQLRGEREKRVWPAEGQPFQLTQCFPLNSPLWATDPKTQIAYLAVRRFANQAVPQLLGGMAFDEDELIDASERARDVTPIEQHAASLQPAQQPDPEWSVVDHTGEVYTFKTASSAIEACRKILITAAAISHGAITTAWENNTGFLNTLDEAEYGSDADALLRLFGELVPKDPPAPDQPEQKGEAAIVGTDRNQNQQPWAGETSAQDDPAQRSAAEPYTQASAAERNPSEPAEPAQGAPQQASTEPPATPVAQPTPTAPSGPQSGERHDPFWDRDSLRIAPPPGRGGRPDYKGWSALLIPRIRQAWSMPLVNELLTANEDLINEYASNFGSRSREDLMAEFEDAKNRIGTT